MVTITKEGSGFQVDAWVRRPSIYLDTWALSDFSVDSALGERLLGVLKRNGTLLFSWANVLEISRLTGATAENIRGLLTELAEQWFPIEFNPIKVIERENSPVNSSPCLADGFLRAYIPYIYDGPLALSTLVDLLHHDEVKASAEHNYQVLTTEICDLFRSERDLWPVRPHTNKSLHFQPDKPTAFVYDGLMQLIAKEGFPINAQHVLDFFHATVSLAYGDFVLLDKHWKELARKLALPCDRVRVYSKPQIAQLLRDLDQFCS